MMRLEVTTFTLCHSPASNQMHLRSTESALHRSSSFSSLDTPRMQVPLQRRGKSAAIKLHSEARSSTMEQFQKPSAGNLTCGP
ncbi:hypothetical protein Dda_7960 [Drechslerella dactyloides]|uniref:Uncharacterized protein n=1 Tax=Drechslerella dactyloides TaxID=74499 RepID=A0AAD6IR91_DREDA|nr:hypothetical protein Dda_7960 [Drechslerella dactyloides]